MPRVAKLQSLMALALLGLAAGTTSSAAAAEGAGTAQPVVQPSGTAAAAPANPIQDLVQQRKYSDAILKVTELRTAAKKPLADAESEYWAARAEAAMKNVPAARARMHAIAQGYPGTPRGRDAAIEGTTVLLNSLGEGKARTPEDRKIATDCAKELEATAGKLTDPEGISRAWFVSGNAWRILGDDPMATKAYERSAAVPDAVDYPGKAVMALSNSALQNFDAATARKHLDDCIKKFPKSSAVEKCGKASRRLSLVGMPAPQIEVETWLSGPPQDITALKGRVVLVWFFATWCPHCKATMPEIAALKQKFAGKPLTIVGITNNSKDQTTETAAAFVSDPQWQITYPAGVDLRSETSIAYHGTGIPSAALVDKKGIVRWVDHPTYLNERMVERLLAE